MAIYGTRLSTDSNEKLEIFLPLVATYENNIYYLLPMQ